MKSKQLTPVITSEKCTGCGRCIAACPKKLLTLEVSGFRKHAQFREGALCGPCRACRTACPVNAISSK